MRKINLFAIATLLLISSVPTIADETAKEKASTSELSILEPVSACRFVGQFTQQKFLSGLNEPVAANGQFLYDCERGVIWQVQQPEPDVLVLRAAWPSVANPNTGKAISGKTISGKTRAYRLLDNTVEQLKGRQSKFLTQLIMSLMGGDQRTLAAQFKITKQADGTLDLSPKKRGLKRAIKSIQVAVFDSKKSSASQPAMRISIVDRNAQTTIINATQGPALETLGQDQCVQTQFPNLACELLLKGSND